MPGPTTATTQGKKTSSVCIFTVQLKWVQMFQRRLTK